MLTAFQIDPSHSGRGGDASPALFGGFAFQLGLFWEVNENTVDADVGGPWLDDSSAAWEQW